MKFESFDLRYLILLVVVGGRRRIVHRHRLISTTWRKEEIPGMRRTKQQRATNSQTLCCGEMDGITSCKMNWWYAAIENLGCSAVQVQVQVQGKRGKSGRLPNCGGIRVSQLDEQEQEETKRDQGPNGRTTRGGAPCHRLTNNQRCPSLCSLCP